MRVLVVDDDPDIRHLLAVALGDAGHEVDHAADGAAALARLPDFQPDVMILDLMMPVQDGFSVLRALRDHHHRPRVVLLSAIVNLREVAYARGMGAESVLAKPFDLDDVLHAVERRSIAR